MEQLKRFGVSERISGFVLPLGYSFNLDGSMIYTTFAALFIAQAYDIPLSMDQQIIMLLVLMVSSKGIAGVPKRMKQQKCQVLSGTRVRLGGQPVGH